MAKVGFLFQAAASALLGIASAGAPALAKEESANVAKVSNSVPSHLLVQPFVEAVDQKICDAYKEETRRMGATTLLEPMPEVGHTVNYCGIRADGINYRMVFLNKMDGTAFAMSPEDLEVSIVANNARANDPTSSDASVQSMQSLFLSRALTYAEVDLTQQQTIEFGIHNDHVITLLQTLKDKILNGSLAVLPDRDNKVCNESLSIKDSSGQSFITHCGLIYDEQSMAWANLRFDMADITVAVPEAMLRKSMFASHTLVAQAEMTDANPALQAPGVLVAMHKHKDFYLHVMQDAIELRPAQPQPEALKQGSLYTTYTP